MNSASRMVLCMLFLLVAGVARGETPAAKIPSAAECLQDKGGTLPGASAVKDLPECHLTWQQAGVMQGFPPTVLVTPDNMWSYPYHRWTLQNASKLMRSTSLCLERQPRQLPRALDPALLSKPLDVNGRKESLAQFAERSFTDAIVILKGGKVAAEWYGNGMTAATPHYAASVSKSTTGLLAEILIARGALDPSRKVTAYVPELASSPFGGATVREILDMKVNVGQSENGDREAESAAAKLYAAATVARESACDILAHVPADGPNDGAFHYSTLTTEVAGWILARATNKPYEQLASGELWSKLGVQDDLYVITDPSGMAGAGHGVNISARDLAKLGQLIADGGKVDGRQVVPAAVIDSLFVRGDAKAWQRGTFGFLTDIESYRSYWYQPKGGRVILAMGIFGQMLYVDRDRNIVLAKLASAPKEAQQQILLAWQDVILQLFAP